jgi:hypothetical protein
MKGFLNYINYIQLSTPIALGKHGFLERKLQFIQRHKNSTEHSVTMSYPNGNSEKEDAN